MEGANKLINASSKGGWTYMTCQAKANRTLSFVEFSRFRETDFFIS